MSLEGKVLGRCRILKKLGEGGMGAVYQARHETLQKDVAVKVLPESLSSNGEFVQRFLREARSAAQLDHPNVVRVLDAGSDGGAHFIVMEYVDGSDLQKLIAKKGKIELRDALTIAKKVAQALGAAHKLGLIHRDIKPANILVTRQGRVYVGDFGLSRQMDAGGTLTTGDQVLGTPHFLAPEQGRGEKMDGRTDLYSLGCTLYCMLSGRPPYTGGTPLSIMMKHTSEKDKPEPLRSLVPNLPAEVEALVTKMMAKEPAQRFQNADELVAEIDRVRGAGPAPDRITADMVLTPQKKRRLLLLGAAAGVGGLILLVFFLALISPGPAEKAYRRALQEPDDAMRAAALARVGSDFKGKWAERARSEGEEITARLLDKELRAVAALAADGKTPFRDVIARVDKVRQAFPGGAPAIDARELELHRARILARTKDFGEYVREGQYSREESITDFINPEKVKSSGPAFARLTWRLYLGLVGAFAGRLTAYQIVSTDLRVIPRKEATVPIRITLQRPGANPPTQHPLVIQWTWTHGDWYLQENALRER